MRKNLPLVILIVVVILVVGGYLGYTSLIPNETPPAARNVKKPPAKIVGDTPSEKNSSDDKSKNVSLQAIEETDILPTDPQAGEIIVWGEVKAVDIDKRVITIEQHLDDNSIEVGPNVPIDKDAVIRSKEEVISLARVKQGDSVGIIVTKEGQARAVLVNY